LNCIKQRRMPQSYNSLSMVSCAESGGQTLRTPCDWPWYYRTKKFETQLRQAQRMESLGSWLAVLLTIWIIALAPILMSIQILNMKITDPNIKKLITSLESGTKRAANSSSKYQPLHMVLRRFCASTIAIYYFWNRIHYQWNVPKNIQLRVEFQRISRLFWAMQHNCSRCWWISVSMHVMPCLTRPSYCNRRRYVHGRKFCSVWYSAPIQVIMSRLRLRIQVQVFPWKFKKGFLNRSLRQKKKAEVPDLVFRRSIQCKIAQ